MVTPELRLGRLQMIASMVIAGTVGLFVFESGQSAFNVVFFRCVFGALGLLAYCAAAGMLKPAHFTRGTLVLTLLGGAAIVFNWVLLFASFHFASISVATAVYNTQPFMLLILGVVLFGERLSVSKLLWLGLAFAGLLLVIGVDPAEAGRGETLFGFLLALGAAFLYAVAAVVAKRLKQVPPQLIALVQVSLGAVLLLPLADFEALPSASAGWGWLLGMGLLHTSLMYILLYSAIQKLPTAVVAVLSFIYPAVAILVDHLFYDQTLEITQWAGIALILLGSAGINLVGEVPRRRGCGQQGVIGMRMTRGWRAATSSRRVCHIQHESSVALSVTRRGRFGR